MHKHLINLIQANAQTSAALGQPDVPRMPEDMQAFYAHFGGALFHPKSNYPFRILPPAEVQFSDLFVYHEDLNDALTQDWYVVAEVGDNPISIVLKKNTLWGHCYDSFWDIWHSR